LHKPENPERPDETWLIPYADFLTLLLALFIVLFASSSIDGEKLHRMKEAFNIALNAGSGVMQYTALSMNGDELGSRTGSRAEQEAKKRAEMFRKEQEDLEQLKKKLDQYIRERGLSSQLETNLNHSALKITIRDTALFDSGSANVKPDARELAVAIAGMLEEHPGYEIVVAGHTDNVPINNSQFASNWELSAERSLNFMRILLDNADLPPHLFSAVGYGEYRPIVENNSAENRAKNRRVEVSILRQYTELEDGTYIQVLPDA
jgi:chemotaxis protein MotB